MSLQTRLRDVRTRLLLAVLAAVTVALAAATVGFNLLLVYANADDADSLLRQRADAERAQVAVVKGRIRLQETFGESVGDSHIWIFQNGRAIEQPRSHPLTTAAALELVGGPSRFVTVKQTHERLYSIPVKANGNRYGTIVAGLSLSPYEQTERSALLASLAFAAVLLVVSWGAARWLLRSALEPVAEMTVQAEAWSENDRRSRR